MKILYIVNNKHGFRVFSRISAIKGLEQKLVIQENFSENLPNDINTIIFSSQLELDNIMKKEMPDIVATTSKIDRSSSIYKYSKKRVFVSHGMVNYWNIKNTKDYLKDFDLHIGASKIYEKFLLSVDSEYYKGKVITGVIPQFDILYDVNKRKGDIRKDILINSNKPNVKKIITLFDMGISSDKTVKNFNEDFINTAIELEKIAARNNWLVLIKFKHNYNPVETIKKISLKKYADGFNKCLNSDYVKCLYQSNSYDYFCSDIIICLSSTSEIEACLCNKPLILVQHSVFEDRFKTVEKKCAISSKIYELEENIKKFNDISFTNIMEKNQNEYIKELGIEFNGMAAEFVGVSIRNFFSM